MLKLQQRGPRTRKPEQFVQTHSVEAEVGGVKCSFSYFSEEEITYKRTHLRTVHTVLLILDAYSTPYMLPSRWLGETGQVDWAPADQQSADIMERDACLGGTSGTHSHKRAMRNGRHLFLLGFVKSGLEVACSCSDQTAYKQSRGRYVWNRNTEVASERGKWGAMHKPARCPGTGRECSAEDSERCDDCSTSSQCHRYIAQCCRVLVAGAGSCPSNDHHQHCAWCSHQKQRANQLKMLHSLTIFNTDRPDSNCKG